jgi:hypothetical protein
MAAIADTSKNVLGQITPTEILLADSGDTLTYTSGANQELILFNTDTVSRTVTIDGSGGTTVAVPGAGATTVSVASGVTYTIAAGEFAVVRLDTISAYCAGTVSIVADVAAKVAACIIK